MIKRMMMLMILIMMMMMSGALVEYKCRLTGGSRRRRRVDPEPLTGFNLMNSLRITEIQFSAIRMQLNFSEKAIVSSFLCVKNSVQTCFQISTFCTISTMLIFLIKIIFVNVSYSNSRRYCNFWVLLSEAILGVWLDQVGFVRRSNTLIMVLPWLALPCPHLFVQPRFWPFHAQLDTLQPQKCWLHSNQHYHHIWLIKDSLEKVILSRSCLMEYGIQFYFQCCVVVVLREERREGCLSSKSLLDGERPGPLSPGLDIRATNCILA